MAMKAYIPTKQTVVIDITIHRIENISVSDLDTAMAHSDCRFLRLRRILTYLITYT